MEIDNIISPKKPLKAGRVSVVDTSKKYQLLYSKLLKENIVICMAKDKLKEVRDKFPNMAIYFPPEIEEMKRIYDKFSDNPEKRKFIKVLNHIKKNFSAWVVPKG